MGGWVFEKQEKAVTLAALKRISMEIKVRGWVLYLQPKTAC